MAFAPLSSARQSSPAREEEDYGVRSLSSTFYDSPAEASTDMAPAAKGTDRSLSVTASTVSSTDSDDTAGVGDDELAATPSLHSVMLQAQLRSTSAHTRHSPPGSPASFASSFEHLSDASRPGMISMAESEAEEGVGSKESGSENDQPTVATESQLVMPTLSIKASELPSRVVATAGTAGDHSEEVLRLCVIGSKDHVLYGDDAASRTTWSADIDPHAALARLEASFAQAQRLLRDDIPRELADSLTRIVEHMPDLAAFDALVLPMTVPPSAESVELAAALHSVVTIIPMVDDEDASSLAALEKQLASQGIQWLGPRDVDSAQTPPFYTTAANDDRPALPTLEDLHKRNVQLFLRWRHVDIAARCDHEVPPSRGALFAEQVARRRARLLEYIDNDSSADSGAAADDEGIDASVHLVRPTSRPARPSSSKGCNGYDDPLSFDFGSLAGLGLNGVSKLARLGVDVILVGACVVGIFGVGLGLGWLGSEGFVTVWSGAQSAWSSLGLSF